MEQVVPLFGVPAVAEYAREEINAIGGYYAFSKEIVNGDSVFDFDRTKLSVNTLNVGLAGIDTRMLTRHIRDRGTCKGLIADAALPDMVGVAELRTRELPKDVVARVSTPKIWTSPAAQPRFHVVAVDCGMKRNIVRSLNALGCDVTIVPWNTTASQVEQLHPGLPLNLPQS